MNQYPHYEEMLRETAFGRAECVQSRIKSPSADTEGHVRIGEFVITHGALIYFRAIARDVESALGRPRSLIGAETQLFRLSRDGNRIRAGRFAREQSLRETLSSRAICHRLGLLRCGPAIFFCSTLKPGNEGGGRGRTQGGRPVIVDRGCGGEE